MDRDHVSVNLFQTSDTSSTGSSLYQEDSYPPYLPLIGKTLASNEMPHSSNGRFYSAYPTNSLHLSTPDILDQVSSTVPPLHYPTTLPDMYLPSSFTSHNHFQNFDHMNYMAPSFNPYLIPSSARPSSSHFNPKDHSFYCAICKDHHPLRLNKAIATIVEHLETHVSILCPVCNKSFSMLKLNNHILHCRPATDAGKICPVCKIILPKKWRKHLLRHIPNFKCPFPDCFKNLSYKHRCRHFEAHVHEVESNKYELISNIKEIIYRKPRSRPKNRKTKRVPRLDQSTHATSETQFTGKKTYPAQHCNIHIGLTNISNVDSTRPIGPRMPPNLHTMRNDVPESSTVDEPPSPDVGGWEKHTKGIGSKLMGRMGYVPGQGLGPRGEGILDPLEAVVLPKRANLDRVMCMRQAGTLFGKSKRVVTPNAKRIEEKDIDRRIMDKTKQLKELIGTIEMHENYLATLQSIIVETNNIIENPSQARNPGFDLNETIEVSDDEVAVFIGPRYNPLQGMSECITISSDDEML